MIPIVIVKSKIVRLNLEQFRNNPFEEMIKFVVDTKKKIIALGGDMHADSEKILLEDGSNQSDLWGANLYPWNNPWVIEYNSLINIRPNDGNRSPDIKIENIRNSIYTIVENLIEL